MFVFDCIEVFLILLCIAANFQLAWKIMVRKHLHTVFNLGYCYYFSLSGIISIFLVMEFRNLLSGIIEVGRTSLANCHRLTLLHVSAFLVYKVFLANILFRYVIIKYSHYGMGKTGSLADTNGWIIKLLYFTFLLSYGLMSFLSLLFKFFHQDTTNNSVKGKICLLEK